MNRDTVTTYVRIIDLAEFEIERAADGSLGRTITGQAVPYGVPIHIPSEGIREQFDHGAFAHQLPALHRVPLTYRHQSQGGEVIGRLASGEELATGLRVHAQTSATTLGNDVLTLVRDGAVSQMSIGFRAKAGWSKLDGGVTRRQRANMFELAIVPEGAYGRHAAVTGVRSMADMLSASLAGDDLDDDESVAGMDHRAARALLDSIPLLSTRAISR